MQKVDPPAQVLEAFRDVQAARTDQERLRNEARAYANRVVPEARGGAAQILQEAEGYKQQAIAEAQGESAALHLESMTNTSARPTSRAGASISRRCRASSAAPTS